MPNYNLFLLYSDINVAAAVLPVCPQLQESCADQASKVEALEVEVLQLQVQAEDSDHAMSEVTACHEAQMASVEQRYNAKVANLEHKHDCLMEKYIQLMHHHNSKLQEQQQSEVRSLQLHKVPLTCSS